MNKRRLKTLRNALEAYNERRKNLRFDLARWAMIDFKYAHEDPAKVVKAAMEGKNYCGTTACACGVAAAIPSFRRAGLRLVRNSEFGDLVLAYLGEQDGEAAMAFFDINRDTMMDLFWPSEYPIQDRRRPLAVVKKIDELLGSAS